MVCGEPNCYKITKLLAVQIKIVEVYEWYPPCKPSQAKPSQNTPNFTFSSTVLVIHKTPFLARVLGKAFFIWYEKTGKTTEKMKIPDKS